jgi:hypothetical protein
VTDSDVNSRNDMVVSSPDGPRWASAAGA